MSDQPDAPDQGSVTGQGSVTDEWLVRDRRVLAPVLAHATDIVAATGQGSWVADVDGRRWLDFTCGIGATNVGHCHPRVVAAIQEQATRLLHTSAVMHNTPTVELAQRLVALVPYLDDPQVFFCNSGAEAVEGAVKLVRQATSRPGIIAFERAFHGRTLGAMTLTTAKVVFREGYEPLLPGVHVAPYAYPLRYGGGEAATEAALLGLDELLRNVGAGTIGAMIVEPVLGEGGYVVPPVEWLRALRDRCDSHGILLIFDEVQCGMGRTGRPFAAETFGVTPDVLLFAKGVADGMPLGGIIAPRELMSRWPTKSHGTTFGGNPVSCAAALASLDVMEENDLCTRAVVLGRRILAKLEEVAVSNPDIVEVRGLGLMIGIELTDVDAARRVRLCCLDGGLVLLQCGPDDNILRLIPPLTVTDDEVAEALRILANALTG